MKSALGLLLTLLPLAARARTTAPAAAPAPAPGVTLIQPKNAFELMVQHRKAKDLVVIDVRAPEEFAKGHLPGAINIQYDADTFAKTVAHLDKAKSYLLNCGGGRSSALAAADMAQLGFSSLYDLKGGLSAWTDFGFLAIR